VEKRQDAKFAKLVFEPDEGLDGLAYAVIGAAIEVHRRLGPGFLESAYEEALCAELFLRGISFERQVAVPIEYKGRLIGESRVDLVVAERLVVELKSIERLAPVHRAQLISYLKATGRQLGLLINFNVPILSLGIKRVVLST
jgi:GxxExxY protein